SPRNTTAAWTGNEMVVWSGANNNTGGRYDPSNDTWTATSTTKAPPSRAGHTTVWSGTEVIVWGGATSDNSLNSGGRYNPMTDSWASTNSANAPLGRELSSAVWTGGEMIVWGGYNDDILCDYPYLNSGGRYNPATDGWVGTSTTNTPSARRQQTAVWTGNEMILWGGYNGSL